MPKYRRSIKGLLAEPRAVGPGSLLASQLVASFYETSLPHVARGQLVDLGCGEGPLQEFYSEFVNNAWRIDWTSSLHDVQVEIHSDLNLAIPLRSSSMDVALASDILEHLHSPEQLLTECMRVVRPGGHLIGNVPFLTWIHERPHDYFRYTEYGLRVLLERAGFVNVEVDVLGGGVDVLIDTIAKMTAWVPLLGPSVARLLQRAWMVVRPVSCFRRAEAAFPIAYGFTAQCPFVDDYRSSILRQDGRRP